MTRAQANLQLLEHLKQVVAENPDLRFSQLLVVFGFVQDHPTKDEAWLDEFYVESADLLNRIRKDT